MPLKFLYPANTKERDLLAEKKENYIGKKMLFAVSFKSKITIFWHQAYDFTSVKHFQIVWGI